MKKLLITLACIGIVCTGCFHHHHHKKKAEIVKSKPMAPKYPVIKQPIRKENENPLLVPVIPEALKPEEVQVEKKTESSWWFWND